MTNPYESHQETHANPYSVTPPNVVGPSPCAALRAPSIALIAVSCIAIAVGLMQFAADIFFLMSGISEELEAANRGPMSYHIKLAIRIVWGVVLFLASSFVMYGAINMYSLRSYGLVKHASIVAVLPCVGPCCLLGIPFGIWALVSLTRPGVRECFET